jgi:hypothetical protein
MGAGKSFSAVTRSLGFWGDGMGVVWLARDESWNEKSRLNFFLT